MAEELKLKISLDNKIFRDFGQLEKQIKQFGKNISQGLNFNIFGGETGGQDQLKKIDKSIKEMLKEINKSIGEMPKRIDAVFDNIFVGADNLFKLGRKLGLNIRGFLGDSRAVITLLANDTLGVARDLIKQAKEGQRFGSALTKGAEKFLSSQA